ncbi:MAG: DUF2029 domain-containing protein [Phycisphaeraceae bacterium]|nr:MAG: DUF2029 domain-containing protein [Phycisphaeraceae bacterium]
MDGMSARDRFRAGVLPWALWAGVAGCFGWFLLRAWKGLPTAANPYKGDFEHFYHAAVAVVRGEDLYASHTGGYIYPPLLAALVTPLTYLDARWAQVAWAGVNLALTGVVLWMAWRAWRERVGVPGDRLTAGALVLGAVLLTFEPVRWEFEEGQSDTLVILGMVGALLWMDKRPWLAGVLTGFAVNIKYQAVVLLPYYLVRRRWSAAAGTAVGAVAFGLVPAVMIGWEKNLGYLGRALGGLGNLASGRGGVGEGTHNGLTWEKSVSVPSGLARMLGEGTPVEWVYAGTGLVAGLMFAAGWWVYRGRGVAMFAGRGGLAEGRGLWRGVAGVEWCGLIVAVLALSPQTMVRHSFILLPVHMLAAAVVLVPRAGVARWPVVAGVVVYQLGARLPPGNVEAFKPALEWWQGVSGSTWCLLVMVLTLAWSGVEYARASSEGRALLDPPPGMR